MDADAVGGLSKEQKARISQSFRAAKALLARKRPRLTPQFPHQAGVAGKRIPLSAISLNTSSPLKTKSLNLTNCASTDVLDINKIDDCTDVTSEWETRLSSKETPVKPHELYSNLSTGADESNSFLTPVRQPYCNGLSESLASSSFFDDDDAFDESILEKIDALCEKSGAKSESESSNSNLVECLAVDGSNGEINSSSTSLLISNDVFNKSTQHSGGNQESGVDGLRNSEDILVNSMPDEYAKYIRSLNDRQREAACSDTTTPLMIVAGPGSGKTSTMVGRIVMLLNQGIGPGNILAMTFTTAAASEMRERIAAVAGKAAGKQLTICTFHSFSLQLCRLHAEKLGRTHEFSIYGHGQQRRAVIEAIRLLEDGKQKANHEIEKANEMAGVSSPQYFKDKSKKWLKFVTQAKAAGRTPEDCAKMGDQMGAEILCNYNGILKSCNALDYHDLISCSVKLLTGFPVVFKDNQESWKAIVIDEFQDTSAMQYSLLRILASHKRITIVGDEDQSIFSFNGADASGFDSFRKDFPLHKEVRLNKNYRSTRCIVEAASSLIRNNVNRCQSKDVLTDNASGSKIAIKECSNENSQCAYVVDKIFEITSECSTAKCSFGNIAVLYRRQVSGKIFQTTFRNRKIPFNVHGVAFYRKKVVRAIMAMLRTALPICDDGPFHRAFKALLPVEKEEKKKVIEHIDKVATARKCSFISAASDVFTAKISGTFKRTQLTQGRKVLLTLDMIKKLVHREQSISAVITSVANMIPQKYLLEQRAVFDVDGGKLLNEDTDIRSVLQYLLDDVSNFLATQNSTVEEKNDDAAEGKGCTCVLKAFVDHISERERENLLCRRHDNKDSVTLTTIHQSKGLEWDVVFVVKVNESEIPMLNESNGITPENCTSVEEERRLLYVAMTRARKKLFILYLIMDSNWQVLQPSRFLREIPHHLQEIQDELRLEQSLQGNHQQILQETIDRTADLATKTELIQSNVIANNLVNHLCDEESKKLTEHFEACNANGFLRRFSVEDRAAVSHLFHQWAKKPAFQNPKRLLDKVTFVIDERLRAKRGNHKDVLRTLRSCLQCDEAFHYAISVLKWQQIPADKRAHLVREKQEHFQKQRIENAMSSSTPTPKQIAYLQNLGCTVAPTSRLHASRLIEQYKSL